ncbi:MAG: urea carboxylase-associated family protein [Sphaerobacteraceae bacterium]|nr:MAG: urea carboxylase-associated family protein [Sphaerobacteraceae bacterium]
MTATLTRDDILKSRIPKRSTLVRPEFPTAFLLREGDFLQITDVQSKQVATMVAFNQHDPEECLSTSHTRSGNNSLVLINEMVVYSNRHNPMMVLLEDTCGRHDILYPACDAQSYISDYGIENHANCRDGLHQVLKSRGINYDDIPDPVNWFMNVGLRQRGRFEVREPLSERGDYVLVRATMDMIVGVAACPQDQNAANAFRPTDIQVRIYS